MSDLPVTPTMLIGREAAVDAAQRLLEQPHIRLLTLLGPAGVGKTRLGIEIARRFALQFTDGCYFVDLAPIFDPARLDAAIATSLGLQEDSGGLLADQIVEHIGTRRLLLLLDNFEQIVDEASAIAGLLNACPAIKVIVTSRVPLQVTWEYRFTVAPLALPLESDEVDTIGESAAVQLFMERARSRLPDFVLTRANARVIGEICNRLDGLPLAIELAAGHLDVRSPFAIRDGLRESGLQLLAAGPRDLPQRQQTLEAAIRWSERLLQPKERELFHNLAIFAGGWTADAALKVIGAEDIDVEAALGGLVRSNLVAFDPAFGESGRYRFLEMVREFAVAQLHASNREDELRNYHLHWCLSLALEAEPYLLSHGQKHWVDRLESEHDNLRAALNWCLKSGQINDGVRLAAAVGWMWHIRGYLSEGLDWYEMLLQDPSLAAADSRMRASVQGAWLAHMSSRDGLRSYYSTQARTLAVELGDKSAESWALQLQARASLMARDIEAARSLSQEAYAAAQAANDPACVRYSIFYLGQVARAEGKLESALTYFREAESRNRQDGDDQNLLWNLLNAGQVELDLGREGAQRYYFEALEVALRLGNRTGLANCLLNLSHLELTRGNLGKAARVEGAAYAISRSVGRGFISLSPADPSPTAIRDALGERFAALSDEGAAMPLTEVIAYVRSGGDALERPKPADLLTRREREIAALVANGLTNRQIADRLVIAVQTAERHVSNILGKLNLSSRSQLAAWFVRSSNNT